jgi:hypothetical protein
MQKGGINLGRRLVGPGQANPRGFFEDADFYEFQDRLLRERGHTILVPPDFHFEPLPHEIEQARRLIENRRDLPLWGWKDPRTTLFLPLWKQLLPDAFFLFLYRHPLEVLLSLVRCRALSPVSLVEGLDSWCVYNRNIQQLQQQGGTHCLVCHPYRIVEDLERFLDLLRERTGLSPAAGLQELAALYHANELRRIGQSSDLDLILHCLHPASACLYDQLQKSADWPCAPHGKAYGVSLSLHKLAAFLTGLPANPSGASRRSLLFLLLSLLEPETMEAASQQYGQTVRDLECGKAWLEEQCGNWQQTALKNQAQIERQQGWITELEQARTWLAEDRARWQQTAEDHLAQIKILKSWVVELEQARDWYAEQRTRWEQTAEQLQAQVGQSANSEESARGTAWLAEQRAYWEEAACEKVKEGKE